MIALYILFLIISIAIFIAMSAFAKSLALSIRMAIAFGVFIALSLAATIWFQSVGDEPLPGAVTVYPEPSREAPRETKKK